MQGATTVVSIAEAFEKEYSLRCKDRRVHPVTLKEATGCDMSSTRTGSFPSIPGPSAAPAKKIRTESNHYSIVARPALCAAETSRVMDGMITRDDHLGRRYPIRESADSFVRS